MIILGNRIYVKPVNQDPDNGGDGVSHIFSIVIPVMLMIPVYTHSSDYA